MKEENKKYIVFVSFNSDIPVVASSYVQFDSECNVYVDFSNSLKNAYITSNENYFKQVKKSLSYNKQYKVTKYYL